MIGGENPLFSETSVWVEKKSRRQGGGHEIMKTGPPNFMHHCFEGNSSKRTIDLHFFWSSHNWVPIKPIVGWWFEHWNATLHPFSLELRRPQKKQKKGAETETRWWNHSPKKPPNWKIINPRSLTVRPSKMMVGRQLSCWDSKFSGANC